MNILLSLLIVFSFKTDTVCVVFTNDIVAQFGAGKATFINPDFPPPLGGAASFYTFLSDERARHKDLLLFDSGNMTGGFITGDSVSLDMVADFYKKMGYNAICPGIREFILGKTSIKGLSQKGLSLIASNIVERPDTLVHPDFISPYRIFNVRGVKVGVFGLVTENFDIMAMDWWSKHYMAAREIQTARNMVRLLKSKGADIIVLLSNTGFTHEKRIAKATEGIDFILGGGQGFGLWSPYEDAKTHTVIVRNYSYFSNCGRLQIFYSRAASVVTGYKYDRISLMSEQYAPSRKIEDEF